jgi:hypothetical protein
MTTKNNDGSYQFSTAYECERAKQWAKSHNITYHYKDPWWIRIDFNDPNGDAPPAELQAGFEKYMDIISK